MSSVRKVAIAEPLVDVVDPKQVAVFESSFNLFALGNPSVFYERLGKLPSLSGGDKFVFAERN